MNHSNQIVPINQGFKMGWVYAMAVGSAVGWGAFVLPYEWLSSAGLMAVITGFLIGTILIGVIAINYGYATKSLPVTGGGIAFALASFGRIHGFIAGWALMLGYISIISLNASAVTLVLRLIVPEMMMQGELYEIAGWKIYAPEVAVSSLFLVAFAYLNANNTAISGRVQFLAVMLMFIAVAAVLFGAGIHYTNHGVGPLLLPPNGVSFWSAVATIVAFVPWAYVGFDGIPQLAGEFRFCGTKIMKLLLASVLSASCLYVAIIVAAALAFGDDLSNFASSSWATGAVMASVMGKFGLVLMVLAVSMGVLTGLNGFYVAASRVVLTLSRSQMLPPVFGKVHFVHGTPTVAFYAIMAVCMISPWFGRGALLWIVDMASVGIAITFFYTCACAYKLGREGVVFGMRVQPKSALQAFVGVLGMIISVGFLLLLLLPNSISALSTPSRYALAVWIVLGVIFYATRRTDVQHKSDTELKQIIFAKLG
ncbi:APC family permease [Moraxella sp. Pampa]|uniref:APC family permease n=1 Tax=Moraxella sp. Pampa TaxID=3111978 RepID=UPI002B4157D8|nr:APC family permease [Moraxella sp. Pampa]